MTPEEIQEQVNHIKYARSMIPHGAVMGFAMINPDVTKDYGKVLMCSVGMTELGLPELIITGHNEQSMAPIMGAVIGHICDDKLRLENGMVLDEYSTVRMQAHMLTQQQARVPGVVCLQYYKEQGKWPQFIQLAIADPKNVLPGEQGYDAEYMYDYGQREYWVA